MANLPSLLTVLARQFPDDADVFSRTRTHAPGNICSCDPFINRLLIKGIGYLHFLFEDQSSLHSLRDLLRILCLNGKEEIYYHQIWKTLYR
jgi:hypothetical protein